MLRITLSLLLAALLSGCASTLKMPLQSDAEKVGAAGKAVYLMSVSLQNSCRDRFVPELKTVQVARDGANPKADPMSFKMDSKGVHEFEEKNLPPKYLVRLELDAGNYTIQGLPSVARGFPIRAGFFAPMHSPLNAVQGGVFYLGAVNANVRERKGEEFKAGPTIPLIDQAVACASSGTFDVEIKDSYETDIPLFADTFPQLKGIRVEKSILPPFDRAVAQKWWEQN